MKGTFRRKTTRIISILEFYGKNNIKNKNKQKKPHQTAYVGEREHKHTHQKL